MNRIRKNKVGNIQMYAFWTGLASTFLTFINVMINALKR